MKTIKAIKGTKEFKVGEIRRVDDKTAHNLVGSYWQYVSKSEWKGSKVVKSEPSQEQVEIKEPKKKKNEKNSKKD